MSESNKSDLPVCAPAGFGDVVYWDLIRIKTKILHVCTSMCSPSAIEGHLTV